MLNFNLFKETIKKSFVIDGKSTRSEFWNYQKFMVIFSLLSLIPIILLGEMAIFFVYLFFLFNIITSTTLGIRRLNDLKINPFLILTTFIPFFGILVYYGFIGFMPGTNIDDNIDFNFFKKKNIEKEINS